MKELSALEKITRLKNDRAIDYATFTKQAELASESIELAKTLENNIRRTNTQTTKELKPTVDEKIKQNDYAGQQSSDPVYQKLTEIKNDSTSESVLDKYNNAIEETYGKNIKDILYGSIEIPKGMIDRWQEQIINRQMSQKAYSYLLKHSKYRIISELCTIIKDYADLNQGKAFPYKIIANEIFTHVEIPELDEYHSPYKKQNPITQTHDNSKTKQQT
jgi:hypothetical protein